MKIVFLILLSAFAVKSFPQKVLDWKGDVSVNTFLIQKMHDQYSERRSAFSAVNSRSSAEAYIKKVKANFKSILGEFPGKTPLNPKITGTIQQDGYRIEKIIFESTPGHHVTANLYLPLSPKPLPAALLFCGHEDVSKATESYQKTAILLAKNGFVVFVVDPISQSERYQITDSIGKPLTRGGTTEHTLLNEASNLFGESSPKDELWDNVRALDYLITRKEVDTSRIGCLGNSGGAMQAMYFAAYDERVKIFAPCSYFSSRERTLELTGPADGCAQIPGEGAAQLEFADFMIAAAPKPILILAGKYDFIDYKGAQIGFDELKKFYSLLGKPEQVKFFSYDDGHGISKPKREAAVSWFRKWFYNDPRLVQEGDLKTLSSKELQVTKSGQLNAEFQNERSIVDRNIALFNSYKNQREDFLKLDIHKIKKRIAELLSIDLNNRFVDVEYAGPGRLILRKKNEIPVPLTIVGTEKPGKIILFLNGKNKSVQIDSTHVVITADLRGTGETEDRSEFNDPKYFNKEYRNAMLALHIGKPMVGQRVTDILTIFQFIASDTGLNNLPVEIYASAPSAVSMLHAALYVPNIEIINISNTPKSYLELLRDPTQKDWYSSVIPNVLRHYDLSDLIKLIGESKVR